MMTKTDLYTLEFVFDSSEMPTLCLSLEEAAAPGVSLEEPGHLCRFTRWRRRMRGLSETLTSVSDYGDVEYEDLDISFVVDDSLKNWGEIFNWLQSNLRGADSSEDEEGVCATGTLVLVTPRGDPYLELTFYGMFPISLSEVELDATEGDLEDVTVDATFAYAYYEINKV